MEIPGERIGWKYREKGLLSKRITLEVDVTEPDNILMAGTSMHLSAKNFYRLWKLRG